jgi:hypothetical protein
LAAELQKLSAIDLDFDFDRHQLLEAMPGKADEAVTRGCISMAITGINVSAGAVCRALASDGGANVSCLSTHSAPNRNSPNDCRAARRW